MLVRDLNSQPSKSRLPTSTPFPNPTSLPSRPSNMPRHRSPIPKIRSNGNQHGTAPCCVIHSNISRCPNFHSEAISSRFRADCLDKTEAGFVGPTINCTSNISPVTYKRPYHSFHDLSLIS